MKNASLIFGAATGALMMVAAAGAHAQSWADTTTVTGRIYSDITTQSNKVDGAKAAGSTQGLGYDIKRFYIGFDHKFTDVWSTNVTLDNSLVSGVGQTTYIKKAYLQATIDPAFVVTVGATDMPWVPYVEGIYNYRYLENTVTDISKSGAGAVATSSDWGVHVSGTLPGNIVSYQVSAVNGNGYRNPARQNGFDYEGRLSAKWNQWNFAVGARTGYLGQKVEGTATPNKATRTDALVAWVGDRLRAGAEYYPAKNYSAAIVKGAAKDTNEGWSYFGSYRVSPVYTVFARYDSVKPFKLTNPTRKNDYYNFGLSWNAFKNVDFSVAEKHSIDKFVTGVTPHKNVGDELGVWAQLRY